MTADQQPLKVSISWKENSEVLGNLPLGDESHYGEQKERFVGARRFVIAR